MSSMIFQTPEGTVEIAGPERHRGAFLAREMGMAALDVVDTPDRPDKIRDILVDPVPDLSSYRGPQFRNAIAGILSGSFAGTFDGPDGRVDGPTIAYNTVQVMGSDALKLLVRLHAQCEIHCFVSGRHRVWLADVVRKGRMDGVLRPSMGWGDLEDMLLSRSDQAVVASFSGTEGFPDRDLVAQNGYIPMETTDEEWSQRPEAERFELGVRALRESHPMLEIRPDQEGSSDRRPLVRPFSEYRYGVGTNAFALRQYASGSPTSEAVEDGRSERVPERVSERVSERESRSI